MVNSQFTVNDSVNLSASVQAVINGALTTPNVNVGQSSQLTVFGTVNGNVANAGLSRQGFGERERDQYRDGFSWYVNRNAYRQRRLYAERERHLAHRSGGETAGGFTMGVDYRIGSHFAIGLTGGYAYTQQISSTRAGSR